MGNPSQSYAASVTCHNGILSPDTDALRFNPCRVQPSRPVLDLPIPWKDGAGLALENAD